MDDPLGDAFPCDGAETGGTEVASSGRSMGQQLAFIRIMEWGFLILPESGIIGRRIIIVYSFPLAHLRGCFKGIMYSFGSSSMI